MCLGAHTALSHFFVNFCRAQFPDCFAALYFPSLPNRTFLLYKHVGLSVVVGAFRALKNNSLITIGFDASLILDLQMQLISRDMLCVQLY